MGVNYKKTTDWAAEVNKIAEGRGVDYIFENGGSGTIKQSLDCITMRGNISVVGFLSVAKQEDMLDVASLAFKRSCGKRYCSWIKAAVGGGSEVCDSESHFSTGREEV